MFGKVSGRHALVLRLITVTGLRKGEACALAWSNVDLDGGQLHVRATLSRIGRELVIGEPKTARARRTVPIPAAMVEALRAHRAEQLTESVRGGWRSSLVFTDTQGGPVDPRGVLRVLQDAATAAEVDDVDVHSLRHSAATGWLNAGVTVRQVADLLGHSDVSVTLNTYVHGSAEGARRAVDVWAGELGL